MAGTGEHSAIAQTGAESEGGKAFPAPRSASADTSNRGVLPWSESPHKQASHGLAARRSSTHYQGPMYLA
jgi:hypothetical protein